MKKHNSEKTRAVYVSHKKTQCKIRQNTRRRTYSSIKRINYLLYCYFCTHENKNIKQNFMKRTERAWREERVALNAKLETADSTD